MRAKAAVLVEHLGFGQPDASADIDHAALAGHQPRTFAQRAHEFFEKHGGKSLILARFMPVVRTFTPILAGVGNMNYKLFWTAPAAIQGLCTCRAISLVK